MCTLVDLKSQRHCNFLTLIKVVLVCLLFLLAIILFKFSLMKNKKNFGIISNR